MYTINRIENKYNNKLMPKMNLSEQEVKALKDTLRILIQAHRFFEYDEEMNPESFGKNLIHKKESDFEGVIIGGGPDGRGFYELEDYLIHSAYYTEQGDLIITAYAKRFDEGVKGCEYPENLECFKWSGDDSGAVTSSLYECFVADVPIPTVRL